MKKILPIIIGVVMAYIGWQLWDSNEGSDLKDKEGYYKELCEKGVQVNAILQNEYTQLKGKVLNVITYKYDYEVDGRTYTGEVSTNKLPDIPIIEITYLPDTPEVSEKGDMCKTYQSIKENDSSSFLMYLGIGMFFIGIFVAYSGLKSLFRR